MFQSCCVWVHAGLVEIPQISISVEEEEGVLKIRCYSGDNNVWSSSSCNTDNTSESLTFNGITICLWCRWNTKRAVRGRRPRHSTTSSPRPQRCISPNRCQRSRARCGDTLFDLFSEIWFSPVFQYRHFIFQTKYKKDKEDLANTLYSLLPETLETQFVKEMAETHSEVGNFNRRVART